MIALKENPKRNSPAFLVENFPFPEKHRGVEIKPREQRGGICELNVCDLYHFRKGRIKAGF